MSTDREIDLESQFVDCRSGELLICCTVSRKVIVVLESDAGELCRIELDHPAEAGKAFGEISSPPVLHNLVALK